MSSDTATTEMKHVYIIVSENIYRFQYFKPFVIICLGDAVFPTNYVGKTMSHQNSFVKQFTQQDQVKSELV